MSLMEDWKAGGREELKVESGKRKVVIEVVKSPGR